MTKNTIVISRLHLSEETKAIQIQLEGLSIGESIQIKDNKYTKIATNACDVEAVEKVYSSNWVDYKFDRENSIGTYQIRKSVSANEVESVIVGAFEGGSNYWMGLDNSTAIWGKKPKGIPMSTWATQMLLEGETLDLYDVEDTEEKFTLTLDKLIEGIKLNAEFRPLDCDIENGDACTSDSILQYGVFGKLVYG